MAVGALFRGRIESIINYSRCDEPLAYWRSQTQFEVDFTLGDHTAVEVKAKSLVTQRDLSGMRALMEEKIFKKYYVVSLEQRTRRTQEGIEILPMEEFLKKLWSNGL
jgi:predicted AAA+ superfamily ATPase